MYDHLGPLPTFSDVLDDAHFWASNEDEDVRAAYVLAGFLSLPVDRQKGFLRHVLRRFPEGVARDA